MIRDVLQDAGFPVMTFGDAADALERIPRDVGLVLLDLVMPQAALDGFGFLSGARARPELANTPVIVLSGLGASVAEVMDPATASALRITAVITKPVEMPVLLSAVRDALGVADRP
jgi:CheY-like chemotaxis protein